MNPLRKLRVFLCHSSQNKPIVRELHQRLNAEGWIEPWLHEEKLLPGMDWGIEIEKAVETADAVIVFLSNNSVTKEGYVQKELRKVLDVADEKPEGTLFIIPVRFDDCLIPRRLKKWQYGDYFPDQNRKKAYELSVESLRLRANALGIQLLNSKFDTASTKVSKNELSEIQEFKIRAGDFLGNLCEWGK